MKKTLILLLLLISLTSIIIIAFTNKGRLAQAPEFNWNKIKTDDSIAVFPTVMIKKNDTHSMPLGMNALKIDIKVVGHIAVTTLDMTFYNKEKRILEGELYFPLGEGQTVSRFAMDVNGKLREGVVVEKEKGRVAFESTARRTIDPGLLEWTRGNNFKARVYPIPAQGYKRIVVAYEQELLDVNGDLIYMLPLNFREKMSQFDVRIEVFNQKYTPQFSPNSLSNFKFDQWENNFVAESKQSDVFANQALAFNIPGSHHKPKVMMDEKGYFYLNVSPEKQNREKKLPENISILWDVSQSGCNKNIDKELVLIDRYLKKIQDLKVELITFSHDIHLIRNYSITKGDTKALIEDIKNLDYDGATQYGCIDFNKLKGEEILLSSDGLSNFGEKDPSPSAKPILILNSSQEADHSLLNYMAISSGGTYLNLNKLSDEEAFEKMSREVFRFIGMKTNTAVSDYYPSIPSDFTNYFSLAGKLNEQTTELTLLFGFGNEVTHREKIRLDQESSTIKSPLIEKIWAQKKLAQLDLQYDLNKAEIKTLGQKFGIVTRNTSLIVLDRVEDYVEHRITPPEELLKTYKEMIAQQEHQNRENDSSHLEQVWAQFKERIEWWNKKFTIPEKKAKDQSSAPGSIDSQRFEYHSASNADYLEEVEMYDLAVVEEEAVEMVEGEMAVGVASYQMNFEGNGSDDALRVSSGNYQVSLKNGRSKGHIQIEAWDPKSPYVEALKTVEKQDLYAKYLQLRESHLKQPSFYLDVADVFIAKGEKELALRILSNIAELELENHSFLRILAHRLEQLKYYDLAISIYKNVKEIRQEEPQSYRDLGLAYSLNNQAQEAIQELYYVVSHPWDSRFPNIGDLVAMEMNHVINNAKGNLDLTGIDKRFIYKMPVDIRVVLNWDTDNCDMDLWVTDPKGEKCFYSHKHTLSGGRMSNDFTRGYGPEEFIIKKALPRDYKVEVNYFGSSAQKLNSPTTVQVQLYTNYGSNLVKPKEVTRRLGTAKEVIHIGDIHFE